MSRLYIFLFSPRLWWGRPPGSSAREDPDSPLTLTVTATQTVPGRTSVFCWSEAVSKVWSGLWEYRVLTRGDDEVGCFSPQILYTGREVQRENTNPRHRQTFYSMEHINNIQRGTQGLVKPSGRQLSVSELNQIDARTNFKKTPAGPRQDDDNVKTFRNVTLVIKIYFVRDWNERNIFSVFPAVPRQSRTRKLKPVSAIDILKSLRKKKTQKDDKNKNDKTFKYKFWRTTTPLPPPPTTTKPTTSRSRIYQRPSHTGNVELVSSSVLSHTSSADGQSGTGGVYVYLDSDRCYPRHLCKVPHNQYNQMISLENEIEII